MLHRWQPEAGTWLGRPIPCAAVPEQHFDKRRRAGDCGGVLVAAERRPASLQVVTLDDRLADAMRSEGFALIAIAS
jgi:hypothetical protein